MPHEADYTEMRLGCRHCDHTRIEEIGETSPYRGAEDGRFIGWYICHNCRRRSKRPVWVKDFDAAGYYEAAHSEQQED